MMSTSKSILSVSVVAFFVATLFAFSVPAQGEDAGIIYGAYQKNNGMLRIIADPSEARPSENVISWSQSCDCDLSDPEILDDLIQALQDQVDPWHEVGAEGEPPFESYLQGENTYTWCNLTETEIKDRWLSFFPAEFEPTTAAFFKDLSGVVHLKGVVRFPHDHMNCSYPVDPRLIFYLPEGYRPVQSEIHVVQLVPYDDLQSLSRIFICSETGAVYWGIPHTVVPYPSPIVLDGITFRAAEVTE